jgi:hypothetical protein
MKLSSGCLRNFQINHSSPILEFAFKTAIMSAKPSSSEKTLDDFLRGKSEQTVALFNHFVSQFQKIGKVTAQPAKTMIGIATPRKRIVYITQLGKNFIHVVFPFEKPYPDNLCFQKIAQVPGDQQYNHHFRMLAKEDVNEEVRKFMKLAYQLGS